MSVAQIRLPRSCGAWNMRFVRNQEDFCSTNSLLDNLEQRFHISVWADLCTPLRVTKREPLDFMRVIPQSVPHSMVRCRGRGRLRTPIRGAYQRRPNRTKSMDEEAGSHLLSHANGDRRICPVCPLRPAIDRAQFPSTMLTYRRKSSFPVVRPQHSPGTFLDDSHGISRPQVSEKE